MKRLAPSLCIVLLRLYIVLLRLCIILLRLCGNVLLRLYIVLLRLYIGLCCIVPLRLYIVLLLAALGAGAWWLQRPKASAQAELEVPPPSSTAELVVAGLGGFRGIAAEVIWFRADRLWDEGRYGELAQLASWLTFLEPHTPEIWSYSAWNLAYNVSVAMSTPADRWRWVKAGLRLLLDDGLRLNPSDPLLYKELSQMFYNKLGGGMPDSCAPYYREQWKKEAEAAQASGDWSSVRLDPARMRAVDAEYGAQDWTHPLASALYWAHLGLSYAQTPHERAELREAVYYTLMMESRVDPRFAPRALAEMQTAMRENPSPYLRDLIVGFCTRHGLTPE